MAGVDTVKAEFYDLLRSTGRAMAHGIFKNDFEYYAVSFELLDWKGQVVDMLILPVMPSSISESQPNIANVKKTSSAVVSLYNPSFVPQDISLSGNFGRKFRVLLGLDTVNAAAFTFNKDALEDGSSEFNIGIKTGYGVSKRLQRIFKNALRVDNEGRGYKLIYNNYAFNSSFVVEVMTHRFEQDESKNMIWNYNINMRTLAPAAAIRGAKASSMVSLLTFSSLQKAATGLMDAGIEELTEERQELLS